MNVGCLSIASDVGSGAVSIGCKQLSHETILQSTGFLCFLVLFFSLSSRVWLSLPVQSVGWKDSSPT